MRALLILSCAVALAIPAQSQETRTAEPPKATAEDLRPNNPAVPEAYAVEGTFQRIVVMRFKYGADIATGIERLAKEQHINNGIILSAVGSLSSYAVYSIVNNSFPTRGVTQVSGPGEGAEILAMNGCIIGGKPNVHIDLSNGRNAFGGHIHPGTRALSFVIVTVGVLPDDLGTGINRAADRTYR